MAKKQNSQILSPENYIRQRARNLPLFKCLINEGWEENGLAYITVARRHINENITFCTYLVDLKCLGIKDSFFNFNISEYEFDEFVDKLSYNFELSEIDYSLAHNIIHAGWEYAEEIGFKPYKSFLSTTLFMLEEDDDTIPLIDIPCGDENGKPLFVQGPSEDEATANRIIAQLEKNLGTGNFHYILQVDELPREGIDWDDDDDDEDEEEWDADEFDDDDDEWDDEELDGRAHEADQAVLRLEYEENSFEENARAFLELSRYLEEADWDPDMEEELYEEEEDEEDENEEENENFARLMVLTDILYGSIIAEEELNSWMESWYKESQLYTVTEGAVIEMFGLQSDALFTEKDIANLTAGTGDGGIERYLRERWGDLPYLLATEIAEEEDLLLKREKITAALGKFPDHGLIRIEDRIARLEADGLDEGEIRYESVFGNREEITPIEYARLMGLRIDYFIRKENYAGLESLYYLMEDEFDFEDEEDMDEDVALLFSVLLASRISLLKMHLSGLTETGTVSNA